ncbi:MFS transporter [Amycolatopsis circi]|uniref:MFS transporter n=1 Tax=Amycolatopsis circi TaxID=871959 RepID=UPI000E21D562|nr:MFS transporter [Amycolatopsis circi]
MTTADSHATSPGWTSRRVFTLILLAGLGELTIFVFSAVSTALPMLRRDFPGAPAEWVISVQPLVGGVLTPVFGKLADRYGKKRMLVVAGVLIAAGGLIAATATVFPLLLVGRAMQGFITAVVFLSYSLLRDIFPARLVPVAASLSVTGMGVMTVIQPFLTGWLVDEFGWRAVFWFLAAYAALFTAGIAAFVPESPLRNKSRIDWAGAALLGFGLGFLLLGLGRGTKWGWGSAATILVFAVAVVLLTGWLLLDRRIAEPFVDLRLLGARPVLLSVVFAGLISAACGLMLTLIPLMVTVPREVGGSYGFGASATGVALYTAPIGICLLVFGYVAGRSVSAAGPRLTMAVGALFVAAGLAIAALWHDQPWQLVVAALVYAIGQGTTFGAAPNLIISSVPAEQQAVMSSLMECAKSLGPSIATQVVFAVLAATALPAHGTAAIYSGAGLSIGFAIAAAIALVSSTAAFLMPRNRSVTPRTITSPLRHHLAG